VNQMLLEMIKRRGVAKIWAKYAKIQG